MRNLEKLQNKELSVIVLTFTLPLLVMGVIYFKQENKQVLEVPEKTVQPLQVPMSVENLKAKSAMVTELNTGKILFELNEKKQRPIASITKLMTTIVASDNLKKRGINEIEISQNYLTALGDSGLLVGQVWKVKDLIDFTLITSSNDGAQALALSAFNNDENSFVSEMNIYSRKMGLANTQFINETGLDLSSGEEAGAISTAEDVTKILKYIVSSKMDVFSGTSGNDEKIKVGDKVYDSQNTNSLVNKLPGVLISKTGYTDLAGGNLAMVVDFGLNNPVSMVVLGSTAEEREADIARLYNATAKYYSERLRD